MKVVTAIGILAGVFAGAAARLGAEDATGISLAGVIDIHCHSGPDVSARSIDDLELVRLARDVGLRALVLKNHYTMTSDRAQLAMRAVGGIEVFGGIVLNRAVGGLNAEAVRRMVQMDGRRGRIVWLPTFDAENQVRHSVEARPFVPVVRDGQPVPELTEIFQLAAENDLVIATGHSSPEESLILLAAARGAGVQRLLVTHVLGETTHASIEQMRRMTDLGALLECAWLTHLGNPSPAPPVAAATARRTPPVEDCVRAIKAVGAEHFVISSDLGQAGNPTHPDGLRAFMAALKAGGISEAELDLLARRNPAWLLGLDARDR